MAAIINSIISAALASAAATATLQGRFTAIKAAANRKQEAWEALVASPERVACPADLRRSWEHVEESAAQGDFVSGWQGLRALRLEKVEIRPLVGWVEACEGFEEVRLPRAENVLDEGAIVATLQEKGEVVVQYSTHYQVEVYLHVSGLVLESAPDVEDGAFIAPTEAVKAWGDELIRRAGFLRGEVYSWTTSWRDSDGPVLESFSCRTQYWAAVPAELAGKVKEGVTLTVHEGRLIAQALETAEETAVLEAWKKGLRGLEVGARIESAAGLCSLYARPVAWTGQLVREMREFGLVVRGWKLFSQNGSFQSLPDGTKLFRGYQTNSGWCHEVRITPDFVLERLASGNGYTLSLWLSRPVQL